MYNMLRRLVVPIVQLKIRRIVGLEHVPSKHPFLLAANHVSWLDPVYLVAALGRRTSRRIVFVSASAKHQWTQAVLPINWKDPNGSLRHAVSVLKHGSIVGIFPFGDQRRGETKPKTGIARLARWSGSPIVPAVLSNVDSGHTWRSLFAFFTQKRKVEIRFGKPLRFQQTNACTRETLANDAQQVAASLHSLLA